MRRARPLRASLVGAGEVEDLAAQGWASPPLPPHMVLLTPASQVHCRLLVQCRQQVHCQLLVQCRQQVHCQVRCRQQASWVR